MKHTGSTFLSGCAALPSFILFAKELDELSKQDQPNSSFFNFYEDGGVTQFEKYDQAVGWPAVAMATIKPAGGKREVVAVGPDGDYWELEPLSMQESVGRIDAVRGHVRSLTSIDNRIYGCGMGRMVLRREGNGRWREFGPPDSPGKDVIGLEDIDGFGADDLYAVGWHGEVWHHDGKRWRRIDSPVSAILSAVCCADDQLVYAVGKNGTMLRGRADQWDVVDTGRDENLLDVKRYAGALFAVSDFAILRLTDDGLVDEDNFATDDRPGTCLHLLQTADALFSLGTKDLWRKTDGPWHRIV